jgi:hypothetical protein
MRPLGRFAPLALILLFLLAFGAALLIELQGAAGVAEPTVGKRAAREPGTQVPPRPSALSQDERPRNAAEVERLTREVYAGPDFAQPDWRLSVRSRQQKAEQAPREPPQWLVRLLRLFSPTLARTLSILLWVAVAVSGGVLLYYALRWYRARAAQARGLADPVQQAARVALGLDRLPDDICAAADAAWRRGDAVLALSLLYRGALRHLVDRRALRLPASLTEGECLHAVREQMPAEIAQAFGAVTDAWSKIAYAATRPEAFEPLREGYAAHFEARAESAA